MRIALAVTALAMTAGLAACTSHSYAGIDLRAGTAPADLQALAARAGGGDKSAQLELGRRYEAGEGLPVSLSRARKLYGAAASRTGGTIYVYVPPVGKNGRGQVMPMNTGPVVEGLPEARARLDRLNGAGAKRRPATEGKNR